MLAGKLEHVSDVHFHSHGEACEIENVALIKVC